MNRGPGAYLFRLSESWGIWPSLVMVLSQWESAGLTGQAVPARVTLLTLAGTVTIYASDRLLEMRRFEALEARHSLPHTRLLIPMILMIGLPTVFFLERNEWIWLVLLGLGGILYLAVTSRLIPTPPLFKEIIGSCCFTYLVWGLLAFDDASLAAFWVMGLSNFLWSAFQDRERDRVNGFQSLAIRLPGINCALARLAGLIAAAWFLGTAPASSLGWCALLHGIWPRPRIWPIDLAFLPLGLGLLFNTLG